MTAITYATAQIVRVLPRTRITRAMRRLAEQPQPLDRDSDVALDQRVEPSCFASLGALFEGNG